VSAENDNEREVSKSGILICVDIHEWRIPNQHPHEGSIHVWDFDNDKGYLTDCPIEEVAAWLHEGLFISLFAEDGRRRKLQFNPPITGYTIIIEGLFGRREIPVDYHALHSLPLREINKLETTLVKLDI
jgi:hypothetical protein